MDRIKKVSFVIPCYRSEHTLPHVVKEIRETMQKLTQYTYDIFLVMMRHRTIPWGRSGNCVRNTIISKESASPEILDNMRH